MVETETSHHTVRDTAIAQLFLKGTALGIGAVEDGKVAIAIFHTPLLAANLLAYHGGLLAIAIGFLEHQGFACGIEAVDIFGYLVLVVFHQTIGSIDDTLGGTVVLLEFEETGMGEVVLELQDIVDLGTPEGVDALVVIAHHTDMGLVNGELSQNPLLHGIGVLILIDQDIAETVGIAFAYFLHIAKQEVGAHKEVIEVHGIGLPEALLIDLVDAVGFRYLCPEVTFACTAIGSIGIGQHQTVLGHGDAVVEGGGFIHLVIESHLLDDGLEEGARVGLIVDGEVRLVAYIGSLGTEDMGEDGMEGAHTQVGGLLLAH